MRVNTGIQALSELNDARLIQLAKSGDADAYGELYERYAKTVFRFVYSQTSDRLDAEDITADVFLRAWRSLPRYKERGYSFSAYLFRIARNVVIDRRRKRKPVSVVSEDEVLNLPDALQAEPGTVVSTRMRHDELVRIMGQLREDHRTVLVLRFLNELSPSEVSQVMGRSVGAIRALQHRAVSALRQLIPAESFES